MTPTLNAPAAPALPVRVAGALAPVATLFRLVSAG
jgi:hypothetical protein